jgi:demethylspheroidene O-methyltransferase
MATPSRLSDVRAEFPLLATCVYLNSNSTGAVPREAQAALDAYWRTLERWRDEAWEGWWHDLEAYRDELAALLGAPARGDRSFLRRAGATRPESGRRMNARSLLALLHHAHKALDLVRTASRLGLLARLDAGPVGLGALSRATGARPLRLYKFLDGLESLGLVERRQTADDFLTAEYVSTEPLIAAFEAVLGAGSIERDRDRYPWREIHGRLDEVLAGGLDARFVWPPETDDDVRGFERSMAAGCGPIREALTAAYEEVFGPRRRWLDVGGGDGTVAETLLRADSGLSCDVFNLPAAGALVAERARAANLESQLGCVAGDFLAGPLPGGYDVLSFIRVLHDWPADVARALLAKARCALPAGGRLLICEELRTPDRLALQFFWTYFLLGADACTSRLREVEWYTEALAALGFADIRVIPGPFDLVVATR